MPTSKRRTFQLLAFLTCLAAARPASATEIDAERSPLYYTVHGALSVGLGVGSLGAAFAFRDRGPQLDVEHIPLDAEVRESFRPTAALHSDVTVALSISGPGFAHLGLGVERALANSMLVYTETLTTQLFVNTVVKVLIARPRPYTHRSDARVRAYTEAAKSDAYRSFYSGHAGAAFAAATSGSYLFGLRSSDRTATKTLWATEMALAGWTATLRVVAGQHYLSDVLVGALVGSGIGIGVPLAHGYRGHERLGPELAWAAAGLSFGVASASVATVLSVFDEPLAVELRPALLEGQPGVAIQGAF